LKALVLCGILNSSAEFGSIEGGQRVLGSPTEAAILRASIEVHGGRMEANDTKAKRRNHVVYEIPFNSENKWMLTIHGDPQGHDFFAIIKGAPERVLALCKMSNDASTREGIDASFQDLMSRGRRVLCIARRDFRQEDLPENNAFSGSGLDSCNFPLRDFTLMGAFALEDPPKRGVDDAVAQAQRAGVKVVMVTGDHPDTARAIANRIGIVGCASMSEAEEGDSLSATQEMLVVTGSMLDAHMPREDNFTDNEPESVVKWWTKAVHQTRIFARVSPIHKQAIVQAYQKFGRKGTGDIVAMTGDGVNDAPALKQAEVGVAMGQRGTDVAKDASDIILRNDDLASIIMGIEQGRLASENLQKSIMYTLCSKVPQAAPAFAELLGVPQALTVAQVLLIDIGTDIWTAVAYALQPAESRLMECPPRHPRREKIVNARVLLYSYGYLGQLQTLFCWLMFFWATPEVWSLFADGTTPDEYTEHDRFVVMQGMTVYYWTLVMGQIAAAIATTTKTQSVCGLQGPAYGLPNNVLSLMILGELILGLGAIYFPPLQMLFETTWLPERGVMLPVLAFVSIFAIDEVRKVCMHSTAEDEDWSMESQE